MKTFLTDLFILIYNFYKSLVRTQQLYTEENLDKSFVLGMKGCGRSYNGVAVDSRRLHAAGKVYSKIHQFC